MSSSWLLRRCARPWATATHQSIHVASPSSLLGFYRPRARWSGQILPPMSLERCQASPAHEKSAFLVGCIPFKRFYSAGKNKTPWQADNRDWTAAVKTGGLVLLGAGALVASTSCSSPSVATKEAPGETDRLTVFTCLCCFYACFLLLMDGFDDFIAVFLLVFDCCFIANSSLYHFWCYVWTRSF